MQSQICLTDLQLFVEKNYIKKKAFRVKKSEEKLALARSTPKTGPKVCAHTALIQNNA